jgi:DNA (cytosine-5)-methyltransferase 1
MRALDLFCGAGGLSLGFKMAGFRVTGVDISEAAKKTFELNQIGDFKTVDLSKEMVEGDFDIVLGGPPCKPWATVNTVRRDSRHPDYRLLVSFFEHVELLKPKAFMMENVPALGSTPIFRKMLAKMDQAGYSVRAENIRYSEFGAPTIRRRLIVFGLRKDTELNAGLFFEKLMRGRREPKTVRWAIGYLRNKDKCQDCDHVWPELKTIERYLTYYKTNKYGWYILEWDKPAPSFGNVMKTYILHPDSFNGGLTRVISVREAWRIMGFSETFRLPKDCGMTIKYQMAADSVSPQFSYAAATVAKKILTEGE